MVNFQVKTLKGILSDPMGPMRHMQSMESIGPHGTHGTGPFLMGGRPQQKHVLGKNDVSHVEKLCLIPPAILLVAPVGIEHLYVL